MRYGDPYETIVISKTLINRTLDKLKSPSGRFEEIMSEDVTRAAKKG